MARMTIKGTDELSAMLESVTAHSQEIAGRVLYEGAAVVYDQMSAAVSSLEVHRRGTYKDPGEYGGILPEWKTGLQESLGIAPHRHSGGTTDTSVGFDGYNGVPTQRYPSGMPNAMVARMVERGTSWFPAQPFIKKVKQASKAPAQAAMEKTAKQEISKYTK